MAYVNAVDGTSTTVSAATPGIQLDLRLRTTKSRALLGVPVRLVVCASASTAGDTGFVKLVDSGAADKIVVPINKLGEQWYVVDGYLPATNAKYDMLAGGNLSGSLTVYAWSLFELMDIGANSAALAASVGTIGLTADGTVVSGITGTLSQTIGNVTGTMTGTVDVQGQLNQTIALPTISAAGTVASSWTTDGTSSKGVPANSTEWTTLFGTLSGGGAPSYLQLCQEASGNLADSIGAMTLTAYGTGTNLSYQNTITGWSRKAVGITTSGGINGWDTATGGPDMSSTSLAALVYCSVISVSSSRTILMTNQDGTNFGWIDDTAADKLTAYAGSSTGTTGTSTYTGGVNAVFPLLYVYDRTNARAKLYTDAEAFSLSYTATTTNSRRGFGGSTFNLSASARYLYAAWFAGSNAEWLSTNANAKALLQKLGWTIPWS